MAAMSYDAARLLIHLLSQDEFQAPPHRLPTGFSWPGATGNLSFDERGNRRVKLELLQGHAGLFTAVLADK
jgi:ABC-type branched-subunit amino acid transport system substrate-binding protein